MTDFRFSSGLGGRIGVILLLTLFAVISKHQGEGITVRRSQLLIYPEFLLKTYSVSFFLNPIKINRRGWSNILYFCYNRHRAPLSIWFVPGLTRLQICSIVNTKRYCVYSKKLDMGKYSKVEVMQRRYYVSYHYIIKINNREIVNVVNHSPKQYWYLYVYGGSPWFQPANAVIKRFRVRYR